MSTEETRHAAEANRLYWDDVASVSEIANRLGISRRTLYGIIEPRPAGAFCPTCGVEAVFVNRSAVASRTARCPRCTTEVHAEISDISGDVPHAAMAQPDAQGATGKRRALDRRFAIGGAALLGAAVGSLAVVLLLNRE